VSDHITKELAAAEIAKAIAQLPLDEIKKIAEKYDVDITDALEGEPLLKADLVDEDESLIALAKRIGDHRLIDAAKKLEALSKRMDAVEDRLGASGATLQRLRPSPRQS